MAESFPKWKITNHRSSQDKYEERTPTYIVIRLLKTKDKEKKPWKESEKKDLTFKGANSKTDIRLFNRDNGNHVEAFKKIAANLKIYKSSKISFKNRSEKKKFPGKQKSKESVTSNLG